MRHRRVLAATSALALALGMAACGGTEDSGPGAGKLEGTGPVTFVTGKDTSGNLAAQVKAWNDAHANEKVTVIELPESADQQRQQMVQNAQTKSDAYGVLNLDVIWTAEFAANGWIEELKESDFPIDKLLPTTVETGKYFKRLYAIPVTSDGGLLYYRKDLLDAAGVTKPPTTWSEMKDACAKVKAAPANKNLGCYAGQFDKYEGLTVNFSEAVNSAGGEVVDADGKVNVNTPEAKKGLDFLVNWFKDGQIPAKALTFKEEEGRRDFQAGQLIFHRQWPYQYSKANATDGSSKVAGKFAVAPLPGESAAGVSTLGGHNYAISKFTKNKKTALEFMKFMVSEERQRANLEATSQAPTWASLYDDAELVKKFPYLPPLKASIEKANKRPEAVKYQEVSTAIQESAYAALKGDKSSDEALKELQSSLEGLIKK
jgi:multiple sugar transport system substrate-binding protein